MSIHTDSPRADVTPLTWRLAAGAMLGCVAAYWLVPLGIAGQLYYLAFGIVAGVGVALAAWRMKPLHRGPWICIALGLAFASLGNATYTYLELVEQTAPFPSIADVFYLGQRGMFIAGLWMIVRHRVGRRDWPAAMDAMCISLGAGLLLWVYVLDPYLVGTSLSRAGAMVGLAQPMLDLVVAAMGLRLLWSRDARANPAMLLLLASAMIAVVVNAIYVVMTTKGSYYFGHPIDAMWLIQFGVLALAAFHPSMRHLTQLDVRSGTRTVLSRGRIAALTIATLIAPMTLIATEKTANGADRVVIGCASIAMFMLVLARLRGLVRQLERSNDELELSREERGRLLAQTVWSTEGERARVAAELHDGPIQRLAATVYLLDVLANEFDAGVEPRSGLIGSIQASVSAEVESMRKIMADLRPPVLDQRGLVEALRDCALELHDRTSITTDLDLRLERRVDPSLEVVLYRVAQEALANVGKHSHATRVEIYLAKEAGVLSLRIEDDGDGFDAKGPGTVIERGHAGIAIMRERVELSGGEWSLTSNPGTGTTINACFAGPVTQ